VLQYLNKKKLPVVQRVKGTLMMGILLKYISVVMRFQSKWTIMLKPLKTIFLHLTTLTGRLRLVRLFATSIQVLDPLSKLWWTLSQERGPNFKVNT
jgi:hypothetical protein